MTATVVLFDLGGVACRFLPARRLAALASACDLSERAIHERLWLSGFDAACDRGEYMAAESYGRVRELIGLRLEYEGFLAAWARAFEPDPAILALADTLRARYRVALLTDNGPILREALPRYLPDIAERFDPLIFSCELGATKPDRALFAGAAARLGQPPEALLLLDDSSTAIAGARQAGWGAIQVTEEGGLAEKVGVYLAR